MRFKVIFKLYMVFACCPAMSQTALPQFSIGSYTGWYQPSLKKANAALEYCKQKFSGIGDDEFSGNLTVGCFFDHYIDYRWTFRGEAFYWQKTTRQTVTSIVDGQNIANSGKGRAMIQILPITINALYCLDNQQNKLDFYCGMGIGVALTKLHVQAQTHEPDTLLAGTYLTHEIFSAEDTNWGILLQAILGLRYHANPAISFFVEGRFISGQFRVEEPRYKVDEQVLLSGFKFATGVMYSWRYSFLKLTK